MSVDLLHQQPPLRTSSPKFAEALTFGFARGVEEVGSPVLITSAILVGSLAVLTFGSFAPGIHFGMIAIVIVLMALLADLLLLPRFIAFTAENDRHDRGVNAV